MLLFVLVFFLFCKVYGQLYGRCKGPHSLSFAAIQSDGFACFSQLTSGKYKLVEQPGESHEEVLHEGVPTESRATRWLGWYGVGLASTDRLPVVVRILAGPLGSLKCDPPKGNGRRQKKLHNPVYGSGRLYEITWGVSAKQRIDHGGRPEKTKQTNSEQRESRQKTDEIKKEGAREGKEDPIHVITGASALVSALVNENSRQRNATTSNNSTELVQLIHRQTGTTEQPGNQTKVLFIETTQRASAGTGEQVQFADKYTSTAKLNLSSAIAIVYVLF